jgi:hypothetical protein
MAQGHSCPKTAPRLSRRCPTANVWRPSPSAISSGTPIAVPMTRISPSVEYDVHRYLVHDPVNDVVVAFNIDGEFWRFKYVP